jgi:hypothetical protein
MFTVTAPTPRHVTAPSSNAPPGANLMQPLSISQPEFDFYPGSDGCMITAAAALRCGRCDLHVYDSTVIVMSLNQPYLDRALTVLLSTST